MKCDIKIMGCEKRFQNIMNEVFLLNLDIVHDVFIDDRRSGGDALYTAYKTWVLPHKEEITHRLVLQDDVLPNKDLLAIANKLCNLYPNAVISLYSSRKDCMKSKSENLLVEVERGGVTGQAILAPIDLPQKAFNWALSINDKFPHDDVAISEYARTNCIPIYLTKYSFVQHLNPTKSLLGFNNAGKYAKNFSELSLDEIDFGEGQPIPKMVIEASCPTDKKRLTPNYVQYWTDEKKEVNNGKAKN